MVQRHMSCDSHTLTSPRSGNPGRACSPCLQSHCCPLAGTPWHHPGPDSSTMTSHCLSQHSSY